MFGDVNISAILDSFSVSYDKRVRPNYGGAAVKEAARLLASHQGEPGSITDGVPHGNRAGLWRVFSGISRSLRPCVPGFSMHNSLPPSSARNTRIAGIKVRGKREIPEKTRRLAASFDPIPTRENPRVKPPGIEPEPVGGETCRFVLELPRPVLVVLCHRVSECVLVMELQVPHAATTTGYSSMLMHRFIGPSCPKSVRGAF
ncbi:hypothetical protein PR048_022496 [Dryococelus australis]|uniref:Uncharacterized protein n=1 Tax=Dryococelus australis TaxID=614101 RepID=A0ABQ9H1G3_9NEOP|nr:hypothetical protein PR048_022496 [Dryococelus australis]